jgi:hypothetical protein
VQGSKSLGSRGRNPSPTNDLKKEKAGSIRGGTGSGGQSSQQIDAMKN